MAYVHRRVKAGRTIEHRKMQSYRIHTKGVQRGPNHGTTSAKQAKINERVAEEHLRWDLNANFGHRDLTPSSTTTPRTPALRKSWNTKPFSCGTCGRSAKNAGSSTRPWWSSKPKG